MTQLLPRCTIVSSFLHSGHNFNPLHTDPAPIVTVGVSGSLFPGNRVTFTCSVEVSASILSTVRPVVIWRRGTAQLFNNSRTNVSELVSTATSLYESNLTINSIEAADSGNYACEATLVLIATNRVVSTNSSMVSIVVEGEQLFISWHHCMILW